MANKTEKKGAAKNANAKENFNPKTFMEVISGVKIITEAELYELAGSRIQ